MPIKLLVLGDTLAALQRSYEGERDRLEAVASLVELANQIAWRVCDASWQVEVCPNWWAEVYLDVTLTKEQSISDVARPLCRAVAETRRFEPAEFGQSNAGGFVWWQFQPKKGEFPRALVVRVWVGASKVCRQVPTGKMIPEMRVECESVENLEQEERDDAGEQGTGEAAGN